MVCVALFPITLGGPVINFTRITIVKNVLLFVVLSFSAWAASRVGVRSLNGLFPASFCCSLAAAFVGICIYFLSELLAACFASLSPRLISAKPCRPPFGCNLPGPTLLRTSRSLCLHRRRIPLSVWLRRAAFAAAAAIASALPCKVCRSSGIGTSSTTNDIDFMYVSDHSVKAAACSGQKPPRSRAPGRSWQRAALLPV